jgi:U3 small nucleolar RNA-associated protein 14
MSRTHISKLNELRAKTDLELAHLIRNRLERGLGDERARREVRAWLPLVAAPDRGALERMVAEWDRRSVCVVCRAAGA